MSYIAWLIVACEIGFWIVIALGFVTRYILKKKRIGLFFLALTPVIDLILLIITSIDLYRGATATVAHGIAAVYLGVSIAFGKSMIRWADERFRYYITKEGPKPIKLYEMEYAKHYLKGWGQHLLAYIIGVGLLVGIIYLADNSTKTQDLFSVIRTWSIVLGVDLLIAISNFIWPKKKSES